MEICAELTPSLCIVSSPLKRNRNSNGDTTTCAFGDRYQTRHANISSAMFHSKPRSSLPNSKRLGKHETSILKYAHTQKITKTKLHVIYQAVIYILMLFYFNSFLHLAPVFSRGFLWSFCLDSAHLKHHHPQELCPVKRYWSTKRKWQLFLNL